MIQTAEGALNETHDILQRMRELAVQAGNDTNTSTDHGEIHKEINQLTSEVNRIGNTTEFNNQKLLNASAGSVSEAAPSVAIDAQASATQSNGTSGNVTYTDATAYTGTTGTWTLATTDGSAFTLDKGDGTGAKSITFTDKKYTVDALELVLPTTPDANDAWRINVTAGVAEGVTTEPAKSSFSTQIGAN